MPRILKILQSGSRIRIVATVLTAGFTTHFASAAPYPPEGLPIEYTQPDGTTLHLKVFGDEFHARTETDEGKVVIFDEAENAYFYAQASGDGIRLEPTSVRVEDTVAAAGVSNEENSSGAKHLFETNAGLLGVLDDDRAEWAKRVQAARARRERKNDSPSAEAGEGDGSAPASADDVPLAVTGSKIGLTILIQFPDDPDTSTVVDPVNFPTTQAKVTNYCNQPGYTTDGNTGSVRDYFYDQSDGTLEYTQIVTNIVTVPHPWSYYNWDDYPTNSVLRPSGNSGRLLVADSIAILKSQGFDFSALSTNSSNRILATNLMFAGPTSGVWPLGLWPHRWSVASPISVGTTQNPMYVSGYQITNAASADIRIGTFCHENGHLLLGYPDLYDTDGGSAGIGRHGLMGSGNHLNGGKTPAPINAYLKDITGWSAVTDLTPNDFVDVTLPSTGNEAYRIRKPGTPSEYFIVENRGTGDPWADWTPDRGLLIWHIDESVANNKREEMTPSEHFKVSVEQADGAFDLENNRDSGDSADLFDSATGPFDDSTNPDAKWWDASDSGIFIEALDIPGANMRVHFGNQPPNTIILESPAPGDLLSTFGPYDIEWNATISQNVRIELFKGGTFHSTIVSSTANDGVYEWEPVDSLLDGTDYSIRISSVADGSIEIFSGQFQIERLLFRDGFETGTLQPAYWTITGTADHRTLVTQANGPHSGDWHVTMDSSVDGSFSRNEMTLTLDIEEGVGVVLEFYAKEFGDEDHSSPPNPFTGGADFDGIAISEDGTTWYEVQPLRGASISSSWQQYSVDLDAAIATHGISYTRDFRIRFNHYDNYTITTDGFAFDDIKLSGEIYRTTTLTLDTASDSGISNSDEITNIAKPLFRGSCRENLGLTIVSDKDGTLGTLSSGGTGNWSFQPPSNLTGGVHNLSISGDAVSTSALTVTIDTQRPGLTLEKAAFQPDPAPSGPVFFTAAFDESVYGFEQTDVSLSGTIAGAASLTGGPEDFQVDVSTTGGDGTVIASISAGVATDAAGNTNTASTSNDNQVVVDGHGGGTGQATAFNLVNHGGGNSSGSDTGWLLSSDMDSFSFSLVSPKRVEIFTTGDINTIGALYDSAESLINNPSADDNAGADLNFLITRVLPPGDYRVDLTSTGGGSDWEYSVFIDISDPPLLINEVDSFTFDDNEMEFIELFDGGRGNLSLDGKVLVFFDGATDTSYHAIDLDGFSTDADGYFVIGSDDLPQTDVTIADSLMNDGTAAVALYDADGTDFPDGSTPTSSDLLDAVVYGPDGSADDPGLAPLLIPADPQLEESANGFGVGQSLQRIPNGIGGLRSGQQFQAVAPTPGAANDLPSAPSSPNLLTADDLGISQSDNLTSVVQPRFDGTATPGAIVRLRSNHEGVVGTAHTDRDGNFLIENHGVNFRGATHNVTVENSSNSAASAPLAVSIDTRRPAVTVNQASGQADPTTVGPIKFKVVFDENVIGFGSEDIVFLSTLSGPVSVTGGPAVYEVSVGTDTDEGYLEVDVSEGAASDYAGNPTRIATHTDNAVTLDIHGDTEADASALALSSGLGTISGWVQPGDSDWILVTLVDPVKLKVSTSGGVDTIGRIMDMGGNVLNVPHLDDDSGEGDNFFSVLVLEAGQYIVEVKGRGQSTGQYSLNVDATEPPYVQPDLAVGTTSGDVAGKDVYDDGTAQSLALHSYQGALKNGTVTIQNDGEVTDDFTVSAPPGDSVFQVSYSTWKDGNITAELITGNYLVEDLAPGEQAPPIVTVITPNYHAVRQVVTRKVKGKKKKKKGKKKKRKVKIISTVHWLQFAKTLQFTATSAIVEDSSDTVRMTIGTN